MGMSVKEIPFHERFSSKKDAGMDPAFPLGGGADPPGRPPTYDFAKLPPPPIPQCMTLRNLGLGVGRSPRSTNEESPIADLGGKGHVPSPSQCELFCTLRTITGIFFFDV